MSARVVDLDAVRELRRLVAGVDFHYPHVEIETVRVIGQAAWRAGDRRWMAWVANHFDEIHDRDCPCRRWRVG